MKFRKGRAAFATIALAGAFCVNAAGSASADPLNCFSNFSGSYGESSYCYTSAAGTIFRGVVRCHFVTSSGSTDHNTWYGPWQTQGDPAWSPATCGSGWSRDSKDTLVG